MLLPALARELAQPDGRELQRRLLGRPCLPRVVSPGLRRGLAADRRALPTTGAGTRRSSRASSTTRTTSRRTAGRAGRPPGCWTSRRASRTSGPCATSPRPSTKGSTRPARGSGRRAKLPGWSSAPTSPGPNGGATRSTACSTTTWSAGACATIPGWSSTASETCGEIVVEYGGTNPVEGSNVQPVGWCLDAWSLGADGVLPWQTVGNGESWSKADELALFYPAARRTERRGRVPSVRLKAYRRGQQDVEYLTLWSRQRGQPRWAVGQQVRDAPAPGRHAPGDRDRPAPRTPAGSTTPGSARRISGPCGPRSARPLPGPSAAVIPPGRVSHPAARPRRATAGAGPDERIGSFSRKLIIFFHHLVAIRRIMVLPFGTAPASRRAKSDPS